MIKKTLIILSLLAISYTSVAQKISSPEKAAENAALQADYMLLTAVGELTVGNVRLAYDMLGSLAASDKDNPTVNYYLAKALQAMGRNDEALTLATQASTSLPDNSDFASLTGQLLIDNQQYARAQELFEQLIKDHPSDGHNYVMAAALAIEQRKADEVIRIANGYEQRFGFDERIIEMKNAALVASKKYYDALGYMQGVVEAMPTSVEHIITLGDLNAGLGLDKQAVDLYERAVTLDSSRVEGYLALAKYYDTKGQTRQYIETLTQIFALQSAPKELKIKLFEGSFFTNAPYRDNLMAIRSAALALLFAHTSDVDVRLLYGRFLTYIGQIPEAREHYINTIEAGAQDRELYDRVIEIDFYQKDYPAALAMSERAMKLWPRDADLSYRHISAIWLAGEPARAVREIKTALKEFKTDSVASSFYTLRGDISHEMGNDRRAFSDYERALRLTPDNALVLNNYAYFLSLTGKDLELALKMATRACELVEDFSTYLDTKAWVLFKMGRLDAAAEVQQRALARDRSDSPELMLHYGDILYALGDDFMARKYWQKALDAGSDKEAIDERMSRPRAVKSAPNHTVEEPKITN